MLAERVIVFKSTSRGKRCLGLGSWSFRSWQFRHSLTPFGSSRSPRSRLSECGSPLRAGQLQACASRKAPSDATTRRLAACSATHDPQPPIRGPAADRWRVSPYSTCPQLWADAGPHTRNECSAPLCEAGQVLVVERRSGSVACPAHKYPGSAAVAAAGRFQPISSPDETVGCQAPLHWRSEEHRKQSSELPNWTCLLVLCCQPSRGC
jgi:hypothetical protein